MKTQRTRQVIFFGGILVVFVIGFTFYYLTLRPAPGSTLDYSLLSIFGVLFLKITFGAATAFAGFLLLLKAPPPESDPEMPIRTPETPVCRRTAVIIPIYHEEPRRVFLGLRRVLDSLRRSGRQREFDLFVLSDSQDPNAWVQEEMEWLDLCRQTGVTGHVFYRRRRTAIHQKSGNVADFCRRWGSNYRYLIVLDADSVMSGAALCRLVEQMEANPRLGIIQTLPRQVLGTTLFARIQQFGSWLYGGIFAAGSRYWHGLTGPYWGHNAIIRVAPFMRYCALPEIPAVGPFRGRFMSHDSVEAAFMRRAGYGVWLDYELEGSFEEGPPDLGTALKRDLRWCKGNMQHITLLGARGLLWESRVLLFTGIWGYASAPLWFLFIVLTVVRQRRMSHGMEDFHPAAMLLILVLILLFLPKVLGTVLSWITRRQRRFHHVLASAACETLFSALMAPIQMVSHTYAVIAAIGRLPTRWSGQDRQGEAADWRHLTLTFGAHTVLGATGLWATWRWNPVAAPWLLPVVVGLLFSIPLSRWLGSVKWGERTRDWGLFVIPEEEAPAVELRGLEPALKHGPGPLFESHPYVRYLGILQVVLDPYVNAAHVALLRSRGETAEDHVAPLGDRLLAWGPENLSAKEELAVLGNSEVLVDLHRRLWISEPGQIAPWWQNALRHYNEAMALTARRKTV